VGGAPGIRVGVSDEESAVVLDASLRELVYNSSRRLLLRTNGCCGVMCLLKKADSWNATVAIAGSFVR
jgi:hypothetical protein